MRDRADLSAAPLPVAFFTAAFSNNAGIMHPQDDNALNTEERIWDLTMNSACSSETCCSTSD
jgi:hypothetical protein